MAVKTYMCVCFKCKTFLQINQKLWPLVISRFHRNKKTPTNIPVTGRALVELTLHNIRSQKCSCVL